MTKEQIDGRGHLLFEALINDSRYKAAKMAGYLTENERMCINQERAYLLSIKEPVVSPLRSHRIHQTLENKVMKSFD